jgi:hypothetical protein
MVEDLRYDLAAALHILLFDEVSKCVTTAVHHRCCLDAGKRSPTGDARQVHFSLEEAKHVTALWLTATHSHCGKCTEKLNDESGVSHQRINL